MRTAKKARKFRALKNTKHYSIFLTMAEVNLLTASFNGKLGELYGASQYGKKFVKAVPFSHAPHSESQKNAFSAFGCLNRFSAGIAKVFFNYMGLSHKKMLKHNAVANLFKPCVANHVFNLTSLSTIIKQDGSTKVDAFNVDYENNVIKADFSTTWENDKKKGSAWVCFIIDARGTPIEMQVPQGQLFSITVKKPLNQNIGYLAGAFRADVINKKVVLHGLAMTKNVYFLDGYLIIDNFPNPNLYSVKDGDLIINDEFVTFENGYLVFNF